MRLPLLTGRSWLTERTAFLSHPLRTLPKLLSTPRSTSSTISARPWPYSMLSFSTRYRRSACNSQMTATGFREKCWISTWAKTSLSLSPSCQRHYGRASWFVRVFIAILWRIS